MDDLFEQISKQHNTEFLVRVSYLEIYQDQLRDLLGDDDDAAALKLREHPKRGVYVEGLTGLGAAAVAA